tara:strand:+ start:211 stop:540 length:330 start_codon:yes stop_codon:yes gene_type:complete
VSDILCSGTLRGCSPRLVFLQPRQVKGLDVDNLEIFHIQVNRAQQQRRRTYRAHGRTNPYMASPSHIELVLSEKDTKVKKADEEEESKRPKKLSAKRLAQKRSNAVVAA